MKKKQPKKKQDVKAKTSTTIGMEAQAFCKYLRIGPRKLRVVIDAIRWKRTAKAFQILALIKKKGARMAERVLKSAVANAKGLGMDESRLIISDIRADGGPVMKRFLSRSQGRADRLLKRMSHLSITVKEGQGGSNPSEEVASMKKEEGSSKLEKVPAKRKTVKAATA